MPPGRPATDYSALKPEIVRRYQSGQSALEIALKIEEVSLRTLQRHMGKWGLTRQAPKVKVDDLELRTQVAIYFVDNLLDNEMVFALQQQGWKCTLR
jgi:hypothetical protein